MRIIVLLALLLAGCANYGDKVKVWLGQPEEALVAAWGPPDVIYTNKKGTRILGYRKNRTVVIPGTSPSGYTATTIAPGMAVVTPVGGTDPMMFDASCMTEFGVIDGIIEGARHKGNDCS